MKNKSLYSIICDWLEQQDAKKGNILTIQFIGDQVGALTTSIIKAEKAYSERGLLEHVIAQLRDNYKSASPNN